MHSFLFSILFGEFWVHSETKKNPFEWNKHALITHNWKPMKTKRKNIFLARDLLRFNFFLFLFFSFLRPSVVASRCTYYHYSEHNKHSVTSCRVCLRHTQLLPSFLAECASLFICVTNIFSSFIKTSTQFFSCWLLFLSQANANRCLRFECC